MVDPIPVFVLSYQRPLYLWSCLDSLYRHTRHPARIVLADNCSPDPMVREVIQGFVHRGLFHAVHLCEDNDPQRLMWMLRRHRDLLPRYFAFVESDVWIAPSDPCWLTRMVDLMDRTPRLGMLGSLIDRSDFIPAEQVERLGLERSERDALVKMQSAEREIEFEPGEELIRPFNPPGRLLMVRTETLDTVSIDRDSKWHKNMKAQGFDTAIATGVVHRHLSLLNAFDYRGYDMRQRDAYFARGTMDHRTFRA